MKPPKRQRPSKQKKPVQPAPVAYKLSAPLSQLHSYASQQEVKARQAALSCLNHTMTSLTKGTGPVAQQLGEATFAAARAQTFTEIKSVIESIGAVNAITCTPYEHKGKLIGAKVTYANGTSERCHEYRSLYMNRMEAEHRLLCRLGLEPCEE